jgi:hypothetical protein
MDACFSTNVCVTLVITGIREILVRTVRPVSTSNGAGSGCVGFVMPVRTLNQVGPCRALRVLPARTKNQVGLGRVRLVLPVRTLNQVGPCRALRVLPERTKNQVGLVRV